MKKLLALFFLSTLVYSAAQTSAQINNLRHYQTVCPLVNVLAGVSDAESNRLATTFFRGIEETLLESGLEFPENAAEVCYERQLPEGALGLTFYVQRLPANEFGEGTFAYQIAIEGVENRIIARTPGAPARQLGDVVVYNTWYYGLKNDRPWAVAVDRLVQDLAASFVSDWQQAHGE